MIEIDGSIGGGSVVRIALGLSAATGKGVRISKVRENRPDPGLKAQHLAGVRALGKLAGEEVRGAEIGSREVVFIPGDFTEERVKVNVETAGSVSLVIQPLQIASLAAEESIDVDIEGGATAGKWAPPVHHLENINFQILERYGFRSDLEVKRHGFYPEGGARVELSLGPHDMERIGIPGRGKFISSGGVSIASGHLEDSGVVERQAEEASRVMKEGFPEAELDIERSYVEASCPGSSISLWCNFGNTVLGTDSLGERGKRAEVVGREAAEEMVELLDSGASADVSMSDQLVPFIGIMGGEFSFQKFTEHMETNIAVTEMFVERNIDVDRGEGNIEAS